MAALLVRTSGLKFANNATSPVTHNAAAAFTVGNRVIVPTTDYTNTANHISSVTIAGTAATKDYENADNGVNQISFWSVVVVNSGRTDVVIATTGGVNLWQSCSIDEWSGLQTGAGYIDATGKTTNINSSSGSATTTSATTQAGGVAYAGAVDIVGTNCVSVTPTNGYTVAWFNPDGTANEGFVGLYKILGTTGVETATWTFGASAQFSTAIVVYKAAPPPTITVQPTNQSVLIGQTATFSVTATGTGSLSYLWYNNGVSTGGTASSYTTPTLTNADNGEQYYCAVTDANGTTTTATVYLFIIGESSADGDKINSAWFTR